MFDKQSPQCKNKSNSNTPSDNKKKMSDPQSKSGQNTFTDPKMVAPHYLISHFACLHFYIYICIGCYNFIFVLKLLTLFYFGP